MNKKQKNEIIGAAIKNLDELGAVLCQKNKQTKEERTCEGCEYLYYGRYTDDKKCMLSTIYWSLFGKLEER